MHARFLQFCRRQLADTSVREFLWYSVPGVLVAVAVRAWLTASLPFAQYHFDTPDFLQTAYDLLHGHRLTLHNKKTFLTPLLYLVPFLLHVPALVLVPLGQHALGVLLVFMSGALCRLWMAAWRSLLVPLTVLTALLPSLLWFEHTLLAETHYVFCVVWLALAGSLFVRAPDWPGFVHLLAALFFLAGSRPEGRLFLAFGVLVALAVYAPRWRREVRKLATLLVFCGVVLIITRTQQAGVLLYASLLHLAPDESRVAPGITDCLREHRALLRLSRAAGVPNDVVRTEKRIRAEILAGYAPAHPELGLGQPGKENPKRLNKLCLKLAIETARQHPWQLPGIVLGRFLSRINEDPGGDFSAPMLGPRQFRSLRRRAERNGVLGVGLAGMPLATDEDVSAYLARRFDPPRVDWFNRWEANWLAGVNALHLPVVSYSPSYSLPGLPWFYLVGLAGMAAALVVPGPDRRFQWCFLPVLAGAWFTVTLTGALVPRYRFVLEPFWLLYAAFALDAATRLCARWLPPEPVPAAPAPAPSSPAVPL